MRAVPARQVVQLRHVQHTHREISFFTSGLLSRTSASCLVAKSYSSSSIFLSCSTPSLCCDKLKTQLIVFKATQDRELFLVCQIGCVMCFSIFQQFQIQNYCTVSPNWVLSCLVLSSKPCISENNKEVWQHL